MAERPPYAKTQAYFPYTLRTSVQRLQSETGLVVLILQSQYRFATRAGALPSQMSYPYSYVVSFAKQLGVPAEVFELNIKSLGSLATLQRPWLNRALVQRDTFSL